MTDLPKGFVSATHSVLFEAPAAVCSVCSAELGEEDEEGVAVRGRGLFLWTRGEERRFEEPELCPKCASAIGMSALHRWETEEDEG